MTARPVPSRRAARGRRLLWASPLPPTRSGVADYAAEILPHLADRATVKVMRPPDWDLAGEPGWAADLQWMERDEDGGRGWPALLHMGNNPYHLWIAERLRRSGGIVVLHDTVLHHLLVEEAAADGQWDRFARELGEAHGARGQAIAEARLWGFSGRQDPFLLPARKVYLGHASGALVHSRTALKQVSEACPDLPVAQVPLAVAALPSGDRARWRQRLGASDADLLLVHLGFVTPVKGLEVVLLALAALAELGVSFRFVVVGEGVEDSSFMRKASGTALADRLVPWGFASQEELGGILSAADLGLVPRYPTAGETSAAALRFLAAGKPIVVSGYGQFMELPREAALRIVPGQQGVVDLVRQVAALAGSPQLLADAGEAARRAWEEGGHRPEKAAAALLAALEDLGDLVA